MMISALAIQVLALVTLPQNQAPPSPVTYDPPARSTVEGVYDCPSGPVTVLYETRAWPSGEEGRTRITSYTSGRLSLPDEAVANWNAALEKIKLFRTLELRCQLGERALVTIVGNDIDGLEVRVAAAIEGRRIRILR